MPVLSPTNNFKAGIQSTDDDHRATHCKCSMSLVGPVYMLQTCS